jgi:hypothetical protein
MRASEVAADPATGRVERRLLPAFETTSYADLWAAHLDGARCEGAGLCPGDQIQNFGHVVCPQAHRLGIRPGVHPVIDHLDHGKAGKRNPAFRRLSAGFHHRHPLSIADEPGEIVPVLLPWPVWQGSETGYVEGVAHGTSVWLSKPIMRSRQGCEHHVVEHRRGRRCLVSSCWLDRIRRHGLFPSFQPDDTRDRVTGVVVVIENARVVVPSQHLINDAV